MPWSATFADRRRGEEQLQAGGTLNFRV